LNIASRAYKIESCLLGAIVMITMAVFSPVICHDFINLDDPFIVYSDPNIQSGLTLDSIRWAFTSEYVSNGVPLTMLSHMLDFLPSRCNSSCQCPVVRIIFSWFLL